VKPHGPARATRATRAATRDAAPPARYERKRSGTAAIAWRADATVPNDER
jgi:hypothetical protein